MNFNKISIKCDTWRQARHLAAIAKSQGHTTDRKLFNKELFDYGLKWFNVHENRCILFEGPVEEETDVYWNIIQSFFDENTPLVAIRVLYPDVALEYERCKIDNECMYFLKSEIYTEETGSDYIWRGHKKDELYNEAFVFLFGESVLQREQIGEVCNRDGCKGVLIEGDKEGDGCYCHKVAPCSYCLQYPVKCPECGFHHIHQA